MNKFLAVPRLKLDNESIETNTSASQTEVELKVETLFKLCYSKAKYPVLRKVEHLEYLKDHLLKIPQHYECLDSSRPWLCYWLCQSLALLNCELSVVEKSNTISFLSKYVIIK